MDTIADHLLARPTIPIRGWWRVTRPGPGTEVVEASRARAAWLLAQRRPGPFHVAVLLDNVPEFVFWLGATALTGAVTVGANPTHRGPDLARDLAHTRCQLLVTDRAHLPLVDGLDLGPAIWASVARHQSVGSSWSTSPTARVRPRRRGGSFDPASAAAWAKTPSAT